MGSTSRGEAWHNRVNVLNHFRQHAAIFRLCVLALSLIPIHPVLAGGASTTLAIRSLTTPSHALAKLELILDTSLPTANPFDPTELDLRVHFTSPKGEAIIVPAFWQGREWHVRFTPRSVGRWHAVAEAQTPNAQVRSGAITFNVLPAASTASGFTKIHPGNPRYLAQEDGRGNLKTFLPIGLNLAWWQADPLKDYERWFDAMQANGANTARIWMSSWAFGLEWADSGLGNYGKRLNRAELLDNVLEMAEQRGIYLIVVLINHGAFSLTTNSEWASNPYNAALGGPCATPRDFATNPQAKMFFKQRLRYIAARWAYSPNILAWEWWNEVDFTPMDTSVLLPWLREMTLALHEHDPNKHLITLSYANDGDPTVWAMPEIDVLQRHEYNIGEPKWFKPIKNLNALQRIPAQVQKPLMFGEFGFSPNGEADTPAGREGIHLHNGLWASVFNGFASTALYWWWDSLVAPANLWPHYKGFAQFMRGQDIARMAPLPVQSSSLFAVALGLKKKDGALVWLRNTAYSQPSAHTRFLMTLSSGEKYSFELKSVHDVVITLAGLVDGVYRVQSYDTITGEPMGESLAQSSNAQLNLTWPSLRSDVAIQITRQ